MSLALSPKLPSERSFGFFFTAIFAGLAVYHFYKGWAQSASVAWLAASFVVGFVTFVAPRALVPFNKAWFLLGQLLGKIVNPIVLGIVFFGLLTPIAFVTRLFGRDALRLKRQAVSSFWIERTPPGPSSDSFNTPF